jgi:hypothetical protein
MPTRTAAAEMKDEFASTDIEPMLPLLMPTSSFPHDSAPPFRMVKLAVLSLARPICKRSLIVHFEPLPSTLT